jgi:hypothetical protein
LAFDNGLLYGYSATGQELTIDPATGSAIFKLNVAGTQAAGSGTANIYGSANKNSAPQKIPEPFTIIGTAIGGTAAFRMRKKLKAIAK